MILFALSIRINNELTLNESITRHVHLHFTISFIVLNIRVDEYIFQAF